MPPRPSIPRWPKASSGFATSVSACCSAQMYYRCIALARANETSTRGTSSFPPSRNLLDRRRRNGVAFLNSNSETLLYPSQGRPCGRQCHGQAGPRCTPVDRLLLLNLHLGSDHHTEVQRKRCHANRRPSVLACLLAIQVHNQVREPIDDIGRLA